MKANRVRILDEEHEYYNQTLDVVALTLQEGVESYVLKIDDLFVTCVIKSFCEVVDPVVWQRPEQDKNEMSIILESAKTNMLQLVLTDSRDITPLQRCFLNEVVVATIAYVEEKERVNKDFNEVHVVAKYHNILNALTIVEGENK